MKYAKFPRKDKLSKHRVSVGIEYNVKKIAIRLARDGWYHEGGNKHDKYKHPQRLDVVVIIPRHRTLSTGVARDIAKKVGWI